MKGVIRHRKEEQGKDCLVPFRYTLCAVSATLLSIIFSACLFVACPAMGQSSSAPAGPLRTLVTVHEAHSLNSKEAARGYPVHLRATVTYFYREPGSGHSTLFVHDSTGSVYVNLPSSSERLAVGSIVDLQGTSAAGHFGPIVVQSHIQVIGYSQLPQDALPVSRDLLFTGAEDGQWVEVEGIVHRVFDNGHTVTLKLAMMDGILSAVMVKEGGETYASLIDARVRIHGNAAPVFNFSNQMIGARLFSPGLSAVRIVEAAPSDPFQSPIVPVDSLLKWDQVSKIRHRVHIRGNVTMQWPGASLCIRDETRGICAQTIQDTPLAVGDEADVAGFSAVENSTFVLTDAVFRRVESGQPIAAVPVTTDQTLLAKQNSELIQIEGQLIGRDPSSSDTTLILTSGKFIFTAVLPKNLAGPETDAWKIGSVLRITGVCSMQFDERQSVLNDGMAMPKPTSLRVLMRSPSDILVLQKASWWTPGHALVLLTLALACTLFVLGWVMALRRRVEEQTILLRESEGRFRHMALHDALTGLAARSLLEDRLNVGVEAARRHKTGLALLMVDIDRFKHTNDTYGHQGGDEVLRVTAQRLLQAVRKSDTVARMGGDEFVVLLSDLRNPLMAEEIAANLIESLAVPVLYEGGEVPVSASVGACTAFEEDLDVDFLLRNADAALYHAKARGRNCFQVFSPDMAASRIN